MNIPATKITTTRIISMTLATLRKNQLKVKALIAAVPHQVEQRTPQLMDHSARPSDRPIQSCRTAYHAMNAFIVHPEDVRRIILQS